MEKCLTLVEYSREAALANATEANQLGRPPCDKKYATKRAACKSRVEQPQAKAKGASTFDHCRGVCSRLHVVLALLFIKFSLLLRCRILVLLIPRENAGLSLRYRGNAVLVFPDCSLERNPRLSSQGNAFLGLFRT